VRASLRPTAWLRFRRPLSAARSFDQSGKESSAWTPLRRRNSSPADHGATRSLFLTPREPRPQTWRVSKREARPGAAPSAVARRSLDMRCRHANRGSRSEPMAVSSRTTWLEDAGGELLSAEHQAPWAERIGPRLAARKKFSVALADDADGADSRGHRSCAPRRQPNDSRPRSPLATECHFDSQRSKGRLRAPEPAGERSG
jgi:hypothetical protein